MRKFLAGILIAIAASVALAHGGGTHAKGTIKDLSPRRIVVGTAEGEKAFAVTPRTEFLKGEATVAPGELHQGDRVVVHAKDVNGTLEATQVRAGASAPHSHGK